MKSLDLFSCIGCHAIGFARVGIETVAFCENKEFRRVKLREQFPEIPIYEDVKTIRSFPRCDIIIGGPPCQRTSNASAIHGYRSGESLWPYMLHIGLCSGAEWFVVEQPPGNAAWEAEVACSLSNTGRHVARFEFGCSDIGAPYLRRRVFMVACTSLSRLEIAGRSFSCAIDETKRAANARGDWNPDKLSTIPVDARAAGEFDCGPASRERRELIEALGDSNPPHMAEVIGRSIKSGING